MERKPYIIVAPDYNHKSNGVKVLHHLAYLLTQKGYSAYVTCTNSNPNFPALTLSKNILSSQDAIWIWSEIQQVNFVYAKRWIWYLMFPFDYIHAEHGDNVWCYSNAFLKEGLNPKQVLMIPTIELEIFNNANNNNKREFTLIYIGKGIMSIDQMKEIVKDVPEEKLIIITNQYPAYRFVMADLMRRAKVLYTFDGMTCINAEARLCGCPVVFLDNRKGRKEYLLKDDYGLNGFALDTSLEEIQKANDTIGLFPMDYCEKNSHINEQLDYFIEVTQKMSENYVFDSLLKKDYNGVDKIKDIQKVQEHFYERDAYEYLVKKEDKCLK